MKLIKLFFLCQILLFAQKPKLLLLKNYNENVEVKTWLMSEKLDGVRAFWNGQKLLSRNGKEFAVPIWFTKNFPTFEIDGELWSKRGDFENISSITSKKKSHDGWKKITFNVFEVPNQNGGLLQRLNVLKLHLEQNPTKYINIIKQITCKGKTHLKEFLKEVESKGGEGVVVREPNSPYIAKRTSKALKVKSFQDTECEVVGYKEGNGKYIGKIGSLKCKLKNGILLHVGSGLSERLRNMPPKIGDIITFKYQGFTKSGKPRFPVFLKIRSKKK